MFNNVINDLPATSQQSHQQSPNTQQNGQQQQQSRPPNTPSSSTQSSSNVRRGAFVRINEQPASKALRFRYECEGRSAGSIPGVFSSPENKTFPSIEVVGYKGRAVVVVSCVTKELPYR